MKKLGMFIIGVFLPTQIIAGQMQDGNWSSFYPIEEIQSNWSYTKFKIATSTGCGLVGDGWWKLNMAESTEAQNKALDYKKAMLLAAYMAGKKVSLRCESNAISDFKIQN